MRIAWFSVTASVIIIIFNIIKVQNSQTLGQDFGLGLSRVAQKGFGSIFLLNHNTLQFQISNIKNVKLTDVWIIRLPELPQLSLSIEY